MRFFLFHSENLWGKLEEVTPENWDDFSDLFSRQVVAAKPVKPKAESKPLKQQPIKSKNWFHIRLTPNFVQLLERVFGRVMGNLLNDSFIAFSIATLSSGHLI